MVRHLTSEARAGRVLPFVVTYDGRFVGQVTVGGITWGRCVPAHIGYWVDEAVAGRGVIPTAVALACDHAGSASGCTGSRSTSDPENVASRRVVEKLGFREEGLRPRYLHIDGHWRDHLVYVLNAEEVPGGLHARWRGRPAVLALTGRGDTPRSSPVRRAERRTVMACEDVAAPREGCRVSSGVVYGVIILIWVVVLLPMWLRRHDEVVEERRSVDRFSSAMRTLSGRSRSGDHREVLMPARQPEPIDVDGRPMTVARGAVPARRPPPSLAGGALRGAARHDGRRPRRADSVVVHRDSGRAACSRSSCTCAARSASSTPSTPAVGGRPP